MKKVLLPLLLLGALAGPAQSTSVTTTGAGKPVAAGSCVSSQGNAFIARTSGLDATHITAYCTMIDGLVSDGVWSLLDVLFIFATDTQANALLNLTSSTFSASVTGTVTFTANQGYSAAQAASMVNTTFNPFTASSPNFVQDSATLHFWRISTSNFASAGMNQGGQATKNSMFPRFTDGNLYCDVNASSDDATGIANPTNAAGGYTCSRTASTGYSYYKNGSSLGTRTNTSTAVATGTMQVLPGLNTGDSAMLAAGAGMNATQALAFYNRVHAYLQTIAGVP